MAEVMMRAAPWCVYPLVMLAVVGLHGLLSAGGHGPVVSAYLPVLLAAVSITGLERILPYRRSWRPQGTEVRDDLWFMGLVQMVLPKALMFGLVMLLAGLGAGAGSGSAGLWPHEWPIAAQTLLLILSADFFRYWLHRASHRLPALWRLHAVHHAPEKLYWLNVGRFHPIEKALQWLCDSLPFVVIGVRPGVLAAYFVFYASNGFFQHCNIRLRFGVLNYLVSSAELHRWHHSKSTRESDHNFGNNVIIWDLVFGTWYLPSRRRVRRLGLRYADYPRRFGAQLLAPFRHDAHAGAAPGPRPLLRRLILAAATRINHVWLWPGLYAAARRPRRAQARVLSSILAANRNCAFGSAHGFAAINGAADYRGAVPIHDYEDLRPSIQRQALTGAPVLTDQQPVMYGRTSGTTGSPKLVPVLRSSLDRSRRMQRLFSSLQYRACPGALDGKALGIVSPAVEGRLASGVPFGSVSGHFYQTMPRAVRANYVVPPEVFEIADYDTKYLCILRLALGERDITYLGAANPSSFVRLAEVLNERKAMLMRSVETGHFPVLESLPGHIAAALRPRLAVAAGRRQELRRLARRGCLSFADLWPHIRLVTTWTGGSCGIALAHLRRLLPTQAKICELGYVSTELRGTISLDVDQRAGLPLLTQHFFEFVERSRWEAGHRQTLLLHELEQDREYYLVVTTDSGLYRYFTNDIVRVNGRFKATPLLEFVQKGDGITNITGEKLCEWQVVEAVTRAQDCCGISTPFFVMLADARQRRYELLVESLNTLAEDFAQDVDSRLQYLNLEYAAKRQSGRLHSLLVRPLRAGAGEAYKKFCVQSGQREGQFKFLLLQDKYACRFPFGEYTPADPELHHNAACH